ncbi:hypothetical protein J6590_040243 [Homalodisca vitripennis]|nr:hypothetical protein J6590_040243 [Homalodisca vitripennis]
MEQVVDSNNNPTVGKYSLRPRVAVKSCPHDSDPERVARPRTAKRRTSQRSLHLSKYRRKSANARERSRMREINEAFDALRKVVSWGSDAQGEKATKISTLRLAMRYITTLSEALRDSESPAAEVDTETKSDFRLNTSDVHRRLGNSDDLLDIREKFLTNSSTLLSSKGIPPFLPRNYNSKRVHCKSLSDLTGSDYPIGFFGGSSYIEKLSSTGSIQQHENLLKLSPSVTFFSSDSTYSFLEADESRKPPISKSISCLKVQSESSSSEDNLQTVKDFKPSTNIYMSPQDGVLLRRSNTSSNYQRPEVFSDHRRGSHTDRFMDTGILHHEVDNSLLLPVDIESPSFQTISFDELLIT